MSNVLEALKNVLLSYVDNEPKPPLHVGEAMACWTYLAVMNEAISFEECTFHMTRDPELKKAIQDGIKMCASQSGRMETFMRREGIELPAGSQHKPQSDPQAVPSGAKLTDDEIANAMSIKVGAAVMACANAAVQSIRNDVGQMWIEFQAEQLVYGATLKTLMRKRGWLKVPPPYIPPGMPTSSNRD
ncbi:MAG TPA: DUF3231 family protein [Bacilli bacterium]|nr:DUF3231 family protein [Bacilli bacterium]